MKTIKSVEEFKKFMRQNRDSVYREAVHADDITIHDDWMEDDKWDELYEEREKS